MNSVYNRLFIIMAIIFYSQIAIAQPLPSIQVNGSTGSVAVASNEALQVSISLTTANTSAADADWWLAVYGPGGWSHFDLSGQWLPDLAVTYQGALFDFPVIPVSSLTAWSPGDYQFYFAVDTQMNGLLDMDSLFYSHVSVSLTAPATGQTLQTSDFQYQGAFRLPGEDIRPQTFAYGGNAMTFNPNGDNNGAVDDYPGSLFIMGHGRLAYGELQDGNQVAEVSIPVPVISKTPQDLPQAQFVQDFQDIAQGAFSTLAEIVRAGMAYLDHPLTGPKIHLSWGQHFQDDATTNIASHAWFAPNLSAPDFQGSWFIGNQSPYSVNDYLFEIPAAWADIYTAGRYLATGRYRDGGWSGQGPALFAYLPWTAEGAPAPDGSHLAEIPLLLYESSSGSDDTVSKALQGYQHPDEWEGGAWLTSSSGKSAILFAGNKAVGDKYWYGWQHPAGAEQVCVETAFLGQFTLCRLADGSACPTTDLSGCTGHSDYRGWWSSRFSARFILYDPADLALVATGQKQSWEPQPYASLDIEEHLLLNPDGVETAMLGTGPQRRLKIGDVAYDRNHGLLYVLELYADNSKPVVHVWKIL
ncbi:hypothetical protein [Candidatus Venteria ishoeyi]|uniref:Uncharacterized protein n=1 Tax=Candidatus Venteria ishoeyi TaxID=1899563 RepID=A0A1H6FAN3_9GAMM|nr:hypothetical protein [Candidatus Venteria ishoeyi]SEH06065.1 Uncharacterised protein [Candidatus Venteria ishoeyi]